MKIMWLDYCTSPSDWAIENLASNDIINLLDSNNNLACVSNIIQNNNLIILTIDSIDEELVMFHHFTQIGSNIRNESPRLISLNGFSPMACIVNFKLSEVVFDYSVKKKVPSLENLKISEMLLNLKI